MSLARAYEHRAAHHATPRVGRATASSSRGLLPNTPTPATALQGSTSTPPLALPAPPPETVTVAGRTVRRLSPAEIEERRHKSTIG